MSREEQIIESRIKKIQGLKAEGINPYPYKFEVKNFSDEVKEKYKKLKNNERAKGSVRVKVA